MALTYWESNLAGDMYNTNPSGKVGINNQNPVLELDVIGSMGLTSLLEFKKAGSDVVQLKSASSLGYDFIVWNATKSAYRLFISSAGKVALGTNAAVNKFTVVETTPGNAWAAASFTNTSTVGFGIEVTGGNEDNSTAIFKNYANIVGAELSGRGELFVRDWIASNAGTSANGIHHFRMENDHLRFSFLLEDLEPGIDNGGSNFILRRYDDDGIELGTVIKVIRNTGEILFHTKTVFESDLQVSGILGASITSIPIGALIDVSPTATPTLDGGILRVVNGIWDLADVSTLPQPDLTPYLTKPIADTYYVSLSAFNNHVSTINNPHQTSLHEVLSVNNFTTLPILTDSYIYAGSVLLGDTSIDAEGDTVTVHGNIHVTGNTTFGGSINLYLYELADVADSVALAPDGYILKKVAGAWAAVQDPSNTPLDLSDYYTKSQSDTRFVNVIGDTMTGTLNIVTSDTALTLESADGVDIIKMFTTGVIDPAMYFNTTSTSSKIVFRGGDTFKVVEDTIGDIITVNPDGSIVFGDSSINSATIGNVAIKSGNPSITLTRNGYTSDFKLTNYASYADITQNGSRVTLFNGGSTPNVELFYNNARKLRTTATGVEIFDNLTAQSVSIVDLPMYKSVDGKLVINADVVITGKYLENWVSPGTGNSPGAHTLVELDDVNISSIEGIPAAFVLGRSTASGKVSYLTKTEVITMLDVVSTDIFNTHVDDTEVHVSVQDRINWEESADNISRLFNWDLIYSTHDSREVGLSDINEPGSALSTSDMKYLFYWTDSGGDKIAVKTRFADNADRLHDKPWDEFRYSRAVGSTLLPANSLYARGLYDLGTVHTYDSNVPRDGSWQIETIDSSFLFNQQGTETAKHKYQLATQWIDRETSFDLWARGRDGVRQEWLPWVQFHHSGNTPTAIELYPVLPDEAYDELENEDNWTYEFSTPGDLFELYIGETEGIDWAFSIGHRVINKQYIYEVTPIGIKRIGNIPYKVVEVTTTLSTTSFTIDSTIDRYEVTMHVAANDIQLIIEHNREKPIVINLDNSTLFRVTVLYTNPNGPNTTLIEMEPDVIIEVHPGIWQLN